MTHWIYIIWGLALTIGVAIALFRRPSVRTEKHGQSIVFKDKEGNIINEISK